MPGTLLPPRAPAGPLPCPVAPAPLLLTGGVEEFRLSVGAGLLIVAYTASLLAVNLGGSRVLTYHEAVFCTPAKEMLATGNWLIPTIAGVPFLDKPPLTPWLIATVMAATGSESEWIVRLPSLLSACLISVVVAAVGARWFGSKIGLLAGLIQPTSYYMLQLGRLAECDIQLIAAVTCAMSVFALAHVDGPRGRATGRLLPAAFYLATGLAFLAKGPIGPVFIFSACFLYLAVSQELRHWRFFLDPLGLAIVLILVGGYSLAAWWVYPPLADHWLLHNVGRFRGEMGGQKSAFYYAYHLPLVLLPWFPFTVAAVVRGARQGLLAHPFWRLAACWLVPGLLLLSVSSFKSKHYLAPLLPALSIAAAAGLLGYVRWRQRTADLRHRILLPLVLGACLIAAAIVWGFKLPAAGAICALIGLLAAALVLTGWLERRRQPGAVLAATFAVAWLAIAGVYGFVMPHHDSYRHQTELARRINRSVPAGERVWLVATPESQIVYYLDRPLVRVDLEADFAARLGREPAGRRYVLAPERLGPWLTRLGEVKVRDRSATLLRWMEPGDRVTLFELHGPGALRPARNAERISTPRTGT